jgi:hypothetical protein
MAKGGPWFVEGENKAYTCSNAVTWRAVRWARQYRRPVQVEYRGPRDGGKTRDPNRVNYTVDERGTKRINDPQWWENP